MASPTISAHRKLLLGGATTDPQPLFTPLTSMDRDHDDGRRSSGQSYFSDVDHVNAAAVDMSDVESSEPPESLLTSGTPSGRSSPDIDMSQLAVEGRNGMFSFVLHHVSGSTI